MMPRPECPIYRRAESRAEDLAQALRRLKKLTQVCRRCAHRRDCDAPGTIQDWVARIAQEVLDEFGG
jgi:uncharacterized protein (DUF2336 family)